MHFYVKPGFFVSKEYLQLELIQGSRGVMNPSQT